MPAVDAQTIRMAVLAMYAEKFQQRQIPPDALDDGFDLLREGIIDSLGILEMITRLEEQFGQSLEFADLDPEQLTKVGPLARHLAGQMRG